MRRVIDAVAEVVMNEKFFWFTTMSQGGMNYVEPVSPPRYLLSDADNEAIGEALRLTIAGSRKVSAAEFVKFFNSGHIQQLTEERNKAAMQKYGYKTKRALYKNMLCCWISVFDGKIEIKPTHHKSLDGYSGISNDGPEIQYLPTTCTDAELGAALREGFTRCTSAIG